MKLVIQYRMAAASFFAKRTAVKRKIDDTSKEGKSETKKKGKCLRHHDYIYIYELT